MIEFNPYNMYDILYGGPTYGDIYICSYLGNKVGDLYGYLYLYNFYYELVLSHILYCCAVCDLYFFFIYSQLFTSHNRFSISDGRGI